MAALLVGVALSADQLVVPGRAGTAVPAKLVADRASAGAGRSVVDVAGAGARREARTRDDELRSRRAAARGRREARRRAAARERWRAVDDAAGRLRALLHRAGAHETRALQRSRQGARRSCRAQDRWSPSGRRRLPAGRSPRSAEGLQGRGRDLRIAGHEEARAAADRVAATGPGGRSRRPADAIGRGLAARLLRLPGHGRGRSGRLRSSTGRTSISTRRWRRRSWRARRRCSRRAAGRTRAPRIERCGRLSPMRIASAWPFDSPATEIALGRHREGRDALRPMLDGPLADEANFHYVTATRGLQLKDEHRALARAFVEKFPNSPFADEVLNNLASAFIVDDQDDEADAVFREIARALSGRTLCGARGLEGRMDGVSTGPFQRGAAVLRSRRRAVPAIGLSPVVALLGGPRRDRRPAISKPASRGCGWRPPIITTRITAGSRWRASRKRAAASIAPTLQKAPAAVTIPTAGRIASLLVGGPQSRSDERAAVCAAGVGRFAATAGHHRADAQAPRQRPRRHQRDEARLSAIPRRRRRDAAARRSCR